MLTKEQLEEKLYWTKGKFDFVWDGDTSTAFEIKLPFGIRLTSKRGDGDRIRLYGIDAAKKNTPLGKLSTEFLKQFEGQEVYFHSIKGSKSGHKKGKYGGYLFEIFAEYEGRYCNVNELMMERGLVVPYMVG